MRRRAFVTLAALIPACAASDLLWDGQQFDFPGAPPGPPSPQRLADMLGVNVHFVEPDRGQLDAMQQAGFRWVRCDLDWASVERQRGLYDFGAYDRHYDALATGGFSPYAILDYGNP